MGVAVNLTGSKYVIPVVANYAALPSAASHAQKFFWVENSQGTKWLPGSLGGTYYPKGLYYSNGSTWNYQENPYQATQALVDAGTNNDRFVTPLLLKNAAQWNTKIDVADLPATLILYPTSTPSTVSPYNTLVSDINDTDFDSPSYDFATNQITSSSQLVAQYISAAGVVIGNPGEVNVSVVGNFRRTTSSGTAYFFCALYRIDSVGSETLIATSSNTPSISSGTYVEFYVTATTDETNFSSTDRFSIKIYATKTSTAIPEYSLQLGGSKPLKVKLSLPINVLASSTGGSHNSLSGLQGGAVGEYYHLTSAEYADMASKTYVDTEISSATAGLFDDRGNYNPSTNSGLYPTSGGSGVSGAILKGDLWTINGLGSGVSTSIGTKTVTDGDVVRALSDSPSQTESNWNITENNIGYVPENASNKTNTITGNESSTTLFGTIKAWVDWLTSSKIISILGYTPENTSNKSDSYTSSSSTTYSSTKALVDGLNTKQNTLTSTNFGTFSNGLTAKTTPVDADTINLSDSADSNKAKKLSFTNLKAFLKTYFDTVYTTTNAVTTQITTALSGYATQSWVTSQGYITNVLSALGYTPENVLNKQSDLTASSTKYPTVDAVNTGLSTKLSGYKSVLASSSTLTGTTSETIMLTFTVNGGSFNSTDMINFNALVVKSLSLSQLQFKLRLNTSNTISGSTVIATFTSSTLGNIFAGVRRTMFSIQGGNLIGFNFTTSSIDDSLVSTVGTSSVAYDVSQTYYWILTCTLTNIGDSIKIQNAILSNT